VRDAARSVTGLLIAVVALAGCAKPFWETGAKHEYQDEVGTAKITVVSVIPWAQLEAALSPGFQLSAADALQRVGLAVRGEDEAYLRAVTAALRLSMGSPSAPGGDGKLVEPPKHSPLPALDEVRGALAQSVVSMTDTSRYRLALALLQEVQLLNNYIRHVSAPKDWKKYLVSMDVALMPSRREAEVDANVFISFLPETVPRIRALTVQIPPMVVDAPRIYPIVTSDDVEINQHTRGVKNTGQLLMSLAGGYGPAQAAAETSRTSEDLQRAIGRELNSLQHVASLSGNALVVRFGATYGVGTKFQFVPQTRRVHALLMVPPVKGERGKDRALSILSETVFRNTDGSQLPFRKYEDVMAMHVKEFNRYLEPGRKGDIKKEDLQVFLGHYLDGAVDEFWAKADQLKFGSYATYLAWAGMAHLAMRLPTSVGQLVLPEEPIEKIEKGGGPFAAFDDGKGISIVVPGSALSVDPARWGVKAMMSESGPVSLIPTSVTAKGERVVELRFPAIPGGGPSGIELNYHSTSGTTESLALQRIVVKREPVVGTIRVGSNVVAAEGDGVAEVVVKVVSDKVKSVALDRTPAVLLVGTSVVGSVPVAKPGEVILTLRHATAGQAITIVARDEKGEDLESVSLAVIDSGRAKK